jgi:hypothetical protein
VPPSPSRPPWVRSPPLTSPCATGACHGPRPGLQQGNPFRVSGHIKRTFHRDLCALQNGPRRGAPLAARPCGGRSPKPPARLASADSPPQGATAFNARFGFSCSMVPFSRAMEHFPDQSGPANLLQEAEVHSGAMGYATRVSLSGALIDDKGGSDTRQTRRSVPWLIAKHPLVHDKKCPG